MCEHSLDLTNYEKWVALVKYERHVIRQRIYDVHIQSFVKNVIFHETKIDERELIGVCHAHADLQQQSNSFYTKKMDFFSYMLFNYNVSKGYVCKLLQWIENVLLLTHLIRFLWRVKGNFYSLIFFIYSWNLKKCSLFVEFNFYCSLLSGWFVWR